MSKVAINRAVRLHQELVPLLRLTGSPLGAEQYWRRVDFTKGFGRKLACYGFSKRDRQLRINKVAFPNVNFADVEAALRAGNKLQELYKLAVGTAAIARDANGQYKVGRKGLKIIAMSTCTCRVHKNRNFSVSIQRSAGKEQRYLPRRLPEELGP